VLRLRRGGEQAAMNFFVACSVQAASVLMGTGIRIVEPALKKQAPHIGGAKNDENTLL